MANERPKIEYKSIAKFLDGLREQSDRACVLIAAAFLDEELERLIRARFHAMSAITEKEINYLLTSGPVPPLRSFALRTMIAYATGMIDLPTRKAIDRIREMRNHAAHSTETVRFDQYDWKDLVSAVDPEDRKLVGELKRIQKLMPPDHPGKNKYSQAKIEFVFCCITLRSRLSYLASGVSPEQIQEWEAAVHPMVAGLLQHWAEELMRGRG